MGKRPASRSAFPAEAKGRSEPVAVDKWLGAHSINVPDTPAPDDSGAGKMSMGQ